MTVLEALAFPDDCDPTLPGHPDPYPLLNHLRETDPVHWSDYLKGWCITRYADASSYLRDHRFSRVAYLERVGSQFGADAPALKFQSLELSFTDPPEHTWVKGLLGRLFSPQTMAKARPHIEHSVNAMLDGMAGAHQADLIADFAYPLPGDVIAAMLGVPSEDWAMLREWVEGIVVSRGIVRTPEMMAEGDRVAKLFHEYVSGLIAKRRAARADDLVSALIFGEEKGRRMSDDQIITMIETLFAAGHSTTRSLVANGMLALFKNPAEYERLRNDLSLIPSAVEEMLRFDPPTQAPSPQVATDDVEIGGRTIRKGEIATVLIGAANRDPREFADPERFDIARKHNEHLSFSMGAHYCLGASLARLEAQVAFAALLKRFPNMRLGSNQLQWHKSGRFRVLAALPVEF
ncbi:MAG TPA: cytochrome P450 [Candidatus Binataceae bacterium]|nr:cytochrome P450 [Candidatus Binataceae bacterium]